MKVTRLLSVVVMITGISLIYVYQQTEIFRLAYTGEKKQEIVEDLLDKNALLRYNIERKSSVVYIGEKMCVSSDFQMPDAYCLVRVLPAETGTSREEPVVKRQSLVARIFGIKRQAEAKTINP
ncbi:MAG: hypothetical protein MJA29_12625 [Candidatus Omnitrophica bacterium]|nr:hypothetical protein [Candidatus Omnitrophota bacterium]